MKHELTARRLQFALNSSGMSAQELSNRSSVAKASISQYVNGSHKPSNISSGKMAPILNVNPLWLMGFDVPMRPDTPVEPSKKSPGVSINVLGRVAAGIPIEAVEEVIDTEEITEEMASHGKYFGLLIKGDSMLPAICDQDIVIVRQQDDAESGDTVIALVNGDDATCKRLRKYKEGIELIPNNPSFSPMFFTNEDIQSKPVKIIGKVVELRRKF